MRVIKTVVIILLNLIFISLAGLIIKIILVYGIANFLKQLKDFDIGYSERLDFFLFFIIACFLAIIHKLTKLLLGRDPNLFIQGICTGILGVLSFCLFSGFVVGFRIAFMVTNERLIALIPLFIIGFLLPFSGSWISILLNKIWKK